MTSITTPPRFDQLAGPTHHRPIVIGVGNRDRGDDAAGPIVCDRLRSRPDAATAIRSFVCEGSILDLALHWEPDDRVIIVDAMAPTGTPGRILTLDATTEPLSTPGALSTHEIDVSVAVELARAIGRMPAQLLVVGIEIAHSDWAALPSAPVAEAIDTVVDLVVAELARAHRAANVAG